jgi:methylenetetrahydrofolate reductase (NADPH)
MFFDVGLYVEFVRKCRRAGIVAPIIPGILPIQTYQGFMKMTEFCQTKVPKILYDQLEPIHSNDTRVKQFGIEHCINM